MEYISFRLDNTISKQIVKVMKEFHYTTKTDFLRDAVRERLKQLEKERKEKKAWDALFAARGIFKGKGKAKTDEEWHNWRSNVYSKQLEKELAKEYGWKT